MSQLCYGNLLSGALRNLQSHRRMQCIAKVSTDPMSILKSRPYSAVAVVTPIGVKVPQALSRKVLDAGRRIPRKAGDAVEYDCSHDYWTSAKQGMALMQSFGSRFRSSSFMNVGWRCFGAVTESLEQACFSGSSTISSRSAENGQQVKLEQVSNATGELLATSTETSDNKRSISAYKASVLEEKMILNSEVTARISEADCSLASLAGNPDSVSNEEVKQKKFVVVVESPAKAKTIAKYLGADFLVLPTYGHVRDLAARSGSVRPDDDYAMVWEVPEDARTHVLKIKNSLQGAKCLVLASDPDREGEAIAWHVAELIKAEGLLKNKKIKVVRVTFNEITQNAVLQAMQAPRDICMTLVNAYLARRALDYLIGFALSPVLWRKLPGSRSAGRVQSSALTLVCERENQIEEFVPQEYWTVEAHACYDTASETSMFAVRPTHVGGKRLEQFDLNSEEAAKDLAEKITSSKIKVLLVKKSMKRRNPPKPYITSTLQQDAQTKLGFGAVRTMNLAQKLYEGIKLGNDELTGLITYMRTDGLQISKEAVEKIRAFASKRYGEEYIPAQPPRFDSKVKNAQEAHEAIRPTDASRIPSSLQDVLEEDALSLYSLIWTRTMACQMEQAVYNEVTVDFLAEESSVQLRAFNSSVSFPGFLATIQDKKAKFSNKYDVQDGAACENEGIEKNSSILSLQEGDLIAVRTVEPRQHFTHPPPRFSEGSLVKTMEELGIGRPSTYAATLKTLQSRKYVKIEKHQIIPEVRGRLVTAFLSNYFPNLTDYNFTANLEEQLDEVSGGRLEWKEVLKGFWPDFHSAVGSVMKIPMLQVVDLLQEAFANQFFKGLGENGQNCPSCGIGKLTLKLSRYGSGYFFGCDSYPVCRFKTNFLEDEATETLSEEDKDGAACVRPVAQKEYVVVGLDPSTGQEITLKKGPFGNYIQLGPDGKGRRCFRVPDGFKPDEMTIEKAVELMKYPFLLGKHPEDGGPVWLGIGRQLLYVRHRSAIASVPKMMTFDDLNLEKALELLKGKNVRRRGRKKGKVIEIKKSKSRSILSGDGKRRKESVTGSKTSKKGQDERRNGPKKVEAIAAGKEKLQNKETKHISEKTKEKLQNKKTKHIPEKVEQSHAELKKESEADGLLSSSAAKRKEAKKKEVVKVAASKKVASKKKEKTDAGTTGKKEKHDQKSRARKRSGGEKLSIT